MTVIDRMSRTPLFALDRTAGPHSLITIDRGPDWMFDDRRGCAPHKIEHNPDLFVSDDRGDQKLAARICRRCPFRAECDAWATAHKEPAWVWGGKVRSHNPNQAAKHRRRRARQAAAKEFTESPQLAADMERHGGRVRLLMDKGRTNMQIAAAIAGMDEDRVAAMRWYIDAAAGVTA